MSMVRRYLLVAAAGLVLGVFSPALGLDYGEGKIDPLQEFEKVRQTGHNTAPDAASVEAVRQFYTRLIPSKVIPGSNGVLRFSVEPRSTDRAAVMLLDADGPVAKKSPYRLLAAAGEAEAISIAQSKRLKLAEGQDAQAALKAVDGWADSAFAARQAMSRGERWLLRSAAAVTDGDCTLWLSLRQSKGRTSVFLNGKPVAGPKPGEQFTIPLGRLTKGTIDLAVLVDCTETVSNTQETRQVAPEAWLVCSTLRPAQGARGEQNESKGNAIAWGNVAHPLYALFEAVGVWPKTTLFAIDGQKIADRAVVDFGAMAPTRAAIQFSQLLRPTDARGLCRAKDGKYIFEDGTQGWFFGGHENHPPAHETTQAYIETCRSIGANVIRLIPGPELVQDFSTSELDPAMLDRIHYLAAELGKAGIYLHLTLTSYGQYSATQCPAGLPKECFETAFIRGKPFAQRQEPVVSELARITHPRLIELEKKYNQNLLCSVNPYTGKALKDDPTVMTVEIANEMTLTGREFDWTNRLDPEAYAYRMKLWNQYLVKKYGPMGDRYYQDHPLAKQWQAESLYKFENPDLDLVTWPSRFKGNRNLGARGLSGTFYLDGTRRIADPRISDAMECMVGLEQAWLKTHYDHLRKLGVKVGIGASSDGFNIYQVGARRANVMAGLDVTDGQAYGGAEQVTAGLKGWGYLRSPFYVHGRPSFAREWGSWWQSSNYPWEYIVQTAVLARHNGYDGFAHHKFGPDLYPTTDAAVYRKSISPFSDKRRAGYAVGAWILQRSSIPEPAEKIIIAFPKDDVLYGGANVVFADALHTSFLQNQLPAEEYHFEDVYDGPADRIVFHDGRAPCGDYRKARHAILWSHGRTDRFAQDESAKTKWFALHDIKFAPGQKYVLNDKYLAVADDIHDDAEFAGQLYDALAKWGYKLPFTKDEIGKVWRSLDRTIDIDFAKNRMTVDRDDLQIWMGKLGKSKSAAVSRLAISSDEEQMDAALLPFDTADFKTARQLALWCPWNAQITIKSALPTDAEIYAVNWLGARLFRVKPVRQDGQSLTIAVSRSDDVFFYEIVAPAAKNAGR